MKRVSQSCTLVILLLSVGIIGCAADTDETSGEPPVVEITAVDYAFQAPDTIPSGWVTFQLENRGGEAHYLALFEFPIGKSFEDLRTNVTPLLDSLRHLLHEGAIDTAEYDQLAAQETPAWIGDFQHGGGVGLVAPGHTGQTTLRLEPGKYVMSCFLENPKGRWHALLGMERPITVREASSDRSPPVPDVTMESFGDEITTEGSFQVGEQTVAFTVGRAPEESTSSYSSVHLARLDSGTDVRAVSSWDEHQYRNPAPATFLGGPENVPVGDTVYTTVDLEPGRYGWFSYHDEATTWTREFAVE